MGWMTDEGLFYGGIAITAASFVMGGIFIGLFKYHIHQR